MKLLLNILFYSVLLSFISCSKGPATSPSLKTANLYSIGFYNLENLFDTYNDTLINDEEFLPQGTKQWTNEKYQDKLGRLSTVISDLASQSISGGIDVLGVSEIENKKVLEDLINTDKLKNKHLKIIHYNSPDTRGVDVGLIYNSDVFSPLATASYPLYIFSDDNKRIYTRDVLLVKGILGSETIYVTVNHWPSRRGGEEASRQRRNSAARLNRTIIDSILVKDPNAKIFVMGDLNDNPNNESVKTVLSSKNDLKGLSNSDLYNPFYKNFLEGNGTLAHNDSWSLFDQIIVSKAVMQEKSKNLRYSSHVIYKKDFMMEKFGHYKNYPKRTFSGDQYNYGYSDHFPVFIYLEK